MNENSEPVTTLPSLPACRRLDVAGITALALAALSLGAALIVGESGAETYCFALFRISLAVSVATLLSARGIDIVRVLRLPPAAPAAATDAPATAAPRAIGGELSRAA